MWLAFYNPRALGDVLMLTQGNTKEDLIEVNVEGQVTFITDRTDGKVYGINIHDANDQLQIQGQGQVNLSDQQVNVVNDLIKQAGFSEAISVDSSPKFLVGYVESCVDHEDSDHLSVTETNVGDETLQIVCGADNIRQGLKVLVAKPGAVMPNGSIIWSGQLRGVDSHGMICSTRELNLTDIEDMPGIWELESDLQAGTPLEEVIQYYRS